MHFDERARGGIRTNDLVSTLCALFYDLGWVTGTGGSISMRHGERIFMAPSGVQKERIAPSDVFVLDPRGECMYEPPAAPGKPSLKLSQCAPLFHQAFTLKYACMWPVGSRGQHIALTRLACTCCRCLCGAGRPARASTRTTSAA